MHIAALGTTADVLFSCSVTLSNVFKAEKGYQDYVCVCAPVCLSVSVCLCMSVSVGGTHKLNALVEVLTYVTRLVKCIWKPKKRDAW